jgi:hypothetical protein
VQEIKVQLTNLLVPTMTQMLRSLGGLLDEARAQRPETPAATLFAQRLAPDMCALSAQIRFVCHQVHSAVYRLRGEPIPERLADLARLDTDAPASFEGAYRLIQQALELLENVAAGELDGGEERPIEIRLPDGMTFDLNGGQYVRDWALPHFYFHLVTAYAILRRAGIEIGKADYVPHMFAYVRPLAAESS